MDTTPIIVGAAQWTHKITRPTDPADVIDPFSMVTRTSGQALADAVAAAQAKEQFLKVIDSLVLIEFSSWYYQGGNNRLAIDLGERLGLKPRLTEYTLVGGNTPQLKINEACLALEQGLVGGVLIAGVEASDARAQMKKAGPEKFNWPAGVSPPTELEVSKMENQYSLNTPSRIYAFFETAIRAAAGRSPQEHSRHMGELFERYSEVASKNPHAWFHGVKRTAKEISTPSKSNRYVNYPYTKFMNSFPTVNQSAAVILTTVHNARLCGIPEDQWVYPMGGAHFTDVENFTQRISLTESPTIRHASRLALKQAGVGLQDIEILDIYSCFPSAVEVATKEIGISPSDPRPLTVTGGLPYFGGPGNNYSMHAIVTVTEMIRAKPSAKALVFANGMYLTKHAIGVYGKSKPTRSWAEQFALLPAVQEAIKKSHRPALVERGEGPFRVEAFVINYDKATNKPRYGVALGTLAGTGERTLANIVGTPEELEQLQEIELVGKVGRCRFDEKTKRNWLSFERSAL